MGHGVRERRLNSLYILVRAIHFSQFFPQFQFGDVGSTRMKDVDNHLSSLKQSIC